MYKVMLVDDDYPVLELLSEVVDWGARGLVLCGKYENGMAAWEHAQEEPPDILVTDIGMPEDGRAGAASRMKLRTLRFGSRHCRATVSFNMPSRPCGSTYRIICSRISSTRMT